jgi:sterol desaturase/sphingolipid hydroxylase (fatty acid hydroxylase superfamily)
VFSLFKTFCVFAVMMGLVAVAELALGREKLASRSTIARYALIGAAFIILGKLFSLIVKPEHLFHSILWAVPLILLVDLLYYWMHRAQHAVPWLWRFHAVHHSVEKMGPGAVYNHPLEIPLKALLVPLSLFISDFGPIVAFSVTLHAAYLHSTTRINFGRFAWLIADNRTHRIHHSLEPKHFERNFGQHTLLWDHLFGTAYIPQGREWPDIGLADFPEPRSVVAYLIGKPTR